MSKILALKSPWLARICWPALAVAFVSAVAKCQGASSDLDLSFDAGSSIDGEVRACVIQPDGKLIIGGDFNTLHGALRSKVARLNADGRNDETFLSGLGGIDGYGYINCLALQADGKILIGGAFTSVNGIGRTNLARLNSDGSLDSTFLTNLSGADGEVVSMAIQPDGKIVVAGALEWANDFVRTNVVRLNDDGSLDGVVHVILSDDTDPANPGPGSPRSVALQADGKILIGGAFTSVNGIGRTNLARLKADGTLDNGWAVTFESAEGLGDVACIALPTDHKILVGGTFDRVNGIARTNLARFNADGSLDESLFCPEADAANGEIHQIIPRADGKLIALGSFTPDGFKWWSVALLSTTGVLDTSFENSFSDGSSLVVALQTDGKLVVGGGFWEVGGVTRRSIARLQSDGTLDTSFDNGGPMGVMYSLTCTAVQADGRILIGGPSLYTVNNQTHQGIARLNCDGSLDESFTASVSGNYPYLYRIAPQSDGKILLAGEFSSVNGVTRSGIARLNPDGTLDEGFQNELDGANRAILAVAVQTNRQILVAGYFETMNGKSRYGYARLNPDGTLDNGFANEFFGMPIRKLAVQDDGKIVITGDNMGLYPLRRLNGDGTRDASFSFQIQGMIYDLLIQPDGKILIGGRFDLIQGQARSCLARLNSDGSLDDTFIATTVTADAEVYRLALELDGKIVIAGNFTEINGIARTNLAILNSDGSVDASFNVDLQGVTPDDVAIQSDAKILIAGWFNAVNQSVRRSIARLTGSFVAPTIVSGPQSTTAEVGGGARLEVKAAGFPALQYQWFFNGTNALSGCTNRFLGLSDLHDADSGSYTVVIRNFESFVTSAPVALNVIAAVDRRNVPAVKLVGVTPGSTDIDYADDLGAANWRPLPAASSPQYFFDTSLPVPAQRFYRARQAGSPGVAPALSLNFVPAITLTGNVGESLRLDYIQAIGPTDAWVTLDTVSLTNTTQLYFDVSALGQPPRLYRIVQTR